MTRSRELENFVKNGGTVTAEESYLQKDTDFKATLTKIKAGNPDFLYVPGYYQEVGMIVKQARELGMRMPIAGGDGWDSAKLPEILIFPACIRLTMLPISTKTL